MFKFDSVGGSYVMKENHMKKLFIILLISLISAPAFAHKLSVFAYKEGDKVHLEGYFSDGTPSRGAKVIVTDADGKQIYEGKTDDKGNDQFTLNTQKEVIIKLNAGMGHFGTFNLKPDDGSSTPAKSMTASMASPRTPDSGTSGAINLSQLKLAVQQANEPLAKEIDRLTNKTNMSNIIGGLGFIFGILGLFTYIKYRKEIQKT